MLGHVPNPNLKPCPFCKSPADDFNPDGDMEGYTIMCTGKHTLFHATSKHCPLGTFSYATYDEAVEAWNTRADDPVPAEPTPTYILQQVPDPLDGFEDFAKSRKMNLNKISLGDGSPSYADSNTRIALLGWNGHRLSPGRAGVRLNALIEELTKRFPNIADSLHSGEPSEIALLKAVDELLALKGK